MAIILHKLPKGVIAENPGPFTEVIFYEGDSYTIEPERARIIGCTASEAAFFIKNWERYRKEIYPTLKREKVPAGSTALIDASSSGRLGDNVALSILVRALREKGFSEVDVVCSPKLKQIWSEADNVYESFQEKEYTATFPLSELSLYNFSGTRWADSVLSLFGTALINKTPSCFPRTWEGCQRNLQPVVGVFTQASVAIRQYPYMNELTELLRQSGFKRILILDEKNADGSWKLSLSEVVSRLKKCDFVIGADSGGLHLAGALQKRIFGIFGHTDGQQVLQNYERATAIQSKSCEKAPCKYDVPCLSGNSYGEKELSPDPVSCLQNFPPDKVFSTIEDSLKKVRKVLVVMLTFNLLDKTKQAIESIRSWHDWDLFVIDNESTDGTQEWLKEQNIPFVSKKTSVASAQNIGIEKFLAGAYDYFLLLNNDIVLRYNTIDKLVEAMEKNPALGALTAQEILDCDPYAVDLISDYEGKVEDIVDIPHSAYSCTLLRRSAVEQVGFFDPLFTPRYIEDNDYTLRLRLAGWQFGKLSGALYYHMLGGVVRTIEAEGQGKGYHWDKNIAYYTEKWGIHPHSPQRISNLGAWKAPGLFVKQIESAIEKKGSAVARVKYSEGGIGDTVIRSVIARELKRKFGNQVVVIYTLLHDSSENVEKRRALLQHYPYIDKVETGGGTTVDSEIDVSDLEFQVEWQEVARYGQIKSCRSEIYLSVAGLPTTDLSVDYFTTSPERDWANTYWENVAGDGLKIAISKKGTNRMKYWSGMSALQQRLSQEFKNCKIVDLDSPTLSVLSVAALIDTADIVIGPDSGCSTIAGALKKPCVILFSNRNGQIFRKMFPSFFVIQGECPVRSVGYCDYIVPCVEVGGSYRQKERSSEELSCFKNLSVDKVLAGVAEVVKGGIKC